MNRTTHTTMLVSILILAVLVSAQNSVEKAKTLYLTDVAEARSIAAEKGQDALIYFYMDT